MIYCARIANASVVLLGIVACRLAFADPPVPSASPDPGSIDARPLRIAPSAKYNVCQPIANQLSQAYLIHQVESGKPLSNKAGIPQKVFARLTLFLASLPGTTQPNLGSPDFVIPKNPASVPDVTAVNAFVTTNVTLIEGFISGERLSPTSIQAKTTKAIGNGMLLNAATPLSASDFATLVSFLASIPGAQSTPGFRIPNDPQSKKQIARTNAFINANTAVLDAFFVAVLLRPSLDKAIAINRGDVNCVPAAGGGYVDPKACLDTLANTCGVPGTPTTLKAYSAGIGVDLAAGLSGASWQTTVLTGLASFMTDRAGQELVLWLVDVFEKQLCQNARGWFTQTCDVFEKYRDQAPGTLLASAVRADLEALPISAFKAVFARAGQLRSILAELRDKRNGNGSGVKKELTDLVAAITPDLVQDCASNASGVQLVCGIGAGFYVLEQVASVVNNTWNEQTACTTVTGLVQKASFAGKAKDLHLPSGIKDLIAEQGSTCTPQSYQPKLTQLMGLLRQTNAFVMSLKGPVGNDVTATILTDAATFISLAANYARFADPTLNATIANDLNIAVSSAEIADELYALLLKVRKGLPPLDIIAGLGDVASKLPICSAGASQKAGCIITSTGMLVANLGAIRKRLVDSDGKPSWDEKTICSVLQDFGTSTAVQVAFSRMYGGDANIPTTLKTFFANIVHVDCTKPDGSLAGYKEVREFAHSIFSLEVWISNPPQAGIQTAAQAIGLIHDVIQSGAVIFAPDGSDDVDQLLAVMTALGDILRGEFTDGIRELLVIVAAHSDLFPESVRQYVVLVGDLAGAKTPGDVSAAISAAAMPVGSWKFKRANFFTLTITGVVGAQGANEIPTNTPTNVNLASGYAVGPIAALGLDFQFRIAQSSWTMGPFVSLLDVGQLAWARVTDTGKQQGGMPGNQQSAETQSEVSFFDVLSPGLFLKLGLGRSPLTFGAGVSFAPKLRKYSYVDPMGVQTSDAFNTLRIGIWLAMDLTLFPLAHVH